MTYLGSNAGLFAGLHMLSVIAGISGIVLLIAWAIKTLTHKQLKIAGISLLVLSIVLYLLSTAALGAWGKSHRGMKFKKEMHIMSDDDAMGMSMHDMTQSLSDKTGDAFDRAFIEGMIPHHQGAIDMAEMALESAQHEEIKAMAREIISAQQAEIDQMEQWMIDWGYTE